MIMTLLISPAISMKSMCFIMNILSIDNDFFYVVVWLFYPSPAADGGAFECDVRIKDLISIIKHLVITKIEDLFSLIIVFG